MTTKAEHRPARVAAYELRMAYRASKRGIAAAKKARETHQRVLEEYAAGGRHGTVTWPARAQGQRTRREANRERQTRRAYRMQLRELRGVRAEQRAVAEKRARRAAA